MQRTRTLSKQNNYSVLALVPIELEVARSSKRRCSLFACRRDQVSRVLNQRHMKRQRIGCLVAILNLLGDRVPVALMVAPTS